jgi:hypothetical protein
MIDLPKHPAVAEARRLIRGRARPRNRRILDEIVEDAVLIERL